MSLERQKTNMSSFNEINGLVIDQEKEFYDLLNIHIKSLEEREPVEINFTTELHNFLHASLLKPFESQQMKMKYLNVILEPRIIKMLKLCFWHILCNRFPETVDILVQEDVQKYYKRKLSRNYIKLFQSLPQPKDELLNYIIFTISYLIHFSFYKYFSPQREFFDFRFILNCYHTVLYEFNGIFVSDIYVKMHIEKYFTNKFLDYEKKNMKELLQRQMELRKLNNRKFLGFNLNFPDITGSRDGSEFKEKIMTQLKKDRNRLSLAHEEKHHHVDKNLNRSKLYSNTIDHTGHFSINKSKTYTESESVLSNLKINCNQVSPTIGRLLEYEDLNLPFKKKKMIKHVFEKIDDNQNDMLNQMKLMYQEKDIAAHKKKDAKINQRGKTLIDHYDLRVPPKEYYQKHQKLNKYFKDMLDINYVLTENQDQMSNLPSSVEILNRFNNKIVGEMQHKLEEKALEEKLINQKKQIQHIENMKKESGNEDIFEYPYDGSRSQGRKLIQYINQRCKKQQEIKDKLIQQQKEEEKIEQEMKLKKGRIESLAIQTQFSSLPSLMPQKTLLTSREHTTQLQNIEDQTTKKAQQPQAHFNFSALQQALSKDMSLSNYLSPKQDSHTVKFTDQDSPSKHFSMRKALQSEILTQEKLIEQPPIEDTAENHRKIKSRVMQKEDTGKPSHHGNLPDYILNRALDPSILYEDKRKDYKSKYNSIFEKISVDQNIDDLCHNILQKRNLFSHGLKKKHHR